MKKDATTKGATRVGSGSVLSIAGWPLRRKLALALAIPLLLAATFGGLRVSSALSESSSASTSANQVAVIAPAIEYLNAAERATVAAQSGSTASEGDLIDAIDDISVAAGDLENTAEDSDLNAVQRERVDVILDISQVMRGDGARDLGPATWVAQVRQLESNVTQLVASVNAAQRTPEPRLEQVSQVISGRLSLALQQSLASDRGTAQSASQELFSEIGVEAAAIDRLAASVDADNEDATAAIAELRLANADHAASVRAEEYDFGGRDAYLPYDALATDLLDGVESSLSAAAGDARQSAVLNGFVTAIALAAAILLAMLISRLLLDPIGRVREGALSVARHRLPDAVSKIRSGQQPEPIKPINVQTKEEIGQLARAVDDLHRQAIHLASGEAQLRQTVNAMFVTLSRRSNSLVNQQLALIERLEHDEEDPKRLESLFRLDHLASRMRRTADSLLILADAPNRAAGQWSLTVGEALQAATSGVTDYQRVHVLSHLSTRIGEDAAADVVHMLTELVDNALAFSPPSEPVRVDAKLAADGVTITVTDSGIGVPEAELTQLNADLTAGAEATPESARRMGLFVVSRLAERHGILASLQRNPRGGMTATIVLPATVLPELPQPDPATVARQAEADKAARPGLTTGAVAVAAAEESATSTSRRRTRADKVAAKAEAKRAKKAEDAKKAKEAADAAAARKAAEKAAAEKAAAEKAERAAAEKAAAEKAAAEKAEKAAAEQAAPEAAPAEHAADQPGESPAPSLGGGLLPRREPGANLPRTGADAFLPPETSTATGPLFGARKSQEPPAASAGLAEEAVAGSESAEPTPAEKVARVVPITALAARQRAQADEQAEQAALLAGRTPPAQQDEVAQEADPTPEAPADQPAPVEQPAGRRPDPLSDPLTDPLSDPMPARTRGEERPAAQAPAADAPAAPAPAAQAPAAATPAAEAPAAQAPATEAPAAPSLPTRTRGAAPEINRDMPGLPPAAASERREGDSPIFKSMRSGWLASPGEGEWHRTEVDQGWEIADSVAEERPVVEQTTVGLPRRQPGERLVPGSVSQPTTTKTRDPEAIRRRLSSHAAGVSRGRRAATTTTQHTEAGPA